MNDLSFKPYQDAYDNYRKDLEQLTGISGRLIANAKGVQAERTKDTEKIGKLRSLGAQMEKLPQAFNDARNRYDAAIDTADAAWVQKFRGLCSYAVGTGQADAGLRYLLQECKAYDSAKGDFKLRRALFGQIVDISASVAAATEGQAPASPGVLGQFEAMEDGEARTAFYAKHKLEIQRGLDARQNSNI